MRILLLLLLLLLMLMLRTILLVPMFSQVNELGAQAVLRQPRFFVSPQAAVEQSVRNFCVTGQRPVCEYRRPKHHESGHEAAEVRVVVLARRRAQEQPLLVHEQQLQPRPLLGAEQVKQLG